MDSLTKNINKMEKKTLMRGRQDSVNLRWIHQKKIKLEIFPDLAATLALIRPKNYSPHMAPWYKFINYLALNRLSTLIKEDVYKGWNG